MKLRLLGASTVRAIAHCITIFVALSSSELAAQINFNDFSSTAGLHFNGVAAQATNGSNQKVLRITPDGTPSAAGSAWFSSPQPISSGFSSTFTFQVSSANGAADGFAFVIQNSPSALAALGAGAGGLGYGQGNNPGGISGNGIQNSLAIEFDTFQNVWDDPDGNHVAVQSCSNNMQQPGPPTVPPGSNNEFHTDVDANFAPVSGTENRIAFSSCTLSNGDSPAVFSLSGLNPPVTIADGNLHTATIDYEICNGECSNTLQLTIDGQPVFSGGVSVNLASQLNLIYLNDGNIGSAYVGFTGGTGGQTENADILNWTFTPHTSISITKPTPPGQTTVFSFGAFNFKSTPDLTTVNGNSLTVTAVPVPAGTGVTFTSGTGATCISYGSTGGNCETFHVTCTGPDCGGTYDAEFATSYDLVPPQTTVLKPGFGKYHNPGNDNCMVSGGSLVGTFTNQIDAFFVTRIDPTTKARSGGTGSCWVATQDTPGISNSVSNFIGFNPPVTNSAVNLATAGQTIPLSFEVLSQTSVPVTNLTLCTTPGSCPIGSVSIASFQSSCAVDGDPYVGAVIPADTAGASGLQNLGGGSYQYNWKTPKSFSKTCQTIQVSLGDGIIHVAVFKFK